jgi:hypothetical protein
MSLPLPESFNLLLTEAECAQIDQTLLPTRDRFSIRLKLYALRYLTQVATTLESPVETLTATQIDAQLRLDPNLQQDGTLEEPFAEWFGNLLTASLKPLKQMSSDSGVAIADLSLEQVIDWHRQHLDAALF